MRPRVFPAEDLLPKNLRVGDTISFNEAAGIPRGRPARRNAGIDGSDRASMRPRVFPAEDARRRRRSRARRRGFNEAAGIPRGRPPPLKENGPSDDRFNEAAGIPRGRLAGRRQAGRRSQSFNEAAGIPRGRLFVSVRTVAHQAASMRPRVFPAEDPPHRLVRDAVQLRFNEAAGIPRGRRTHGLWAERVDFWLQ